jgi:urate oxidase
MLTGKQGKAAPMALVRNSYGKARVRIMRVKRDGERHEVRELTVKAMLEGGFSRAYTDADNSAVVATDTIKNIINIVARENIGLDTEPFVEILARAYLDRYPQAERATITAWETRWTRFTMGGAPHAHCFLLDGNGRPLAHLFASRGQETLQSGIEGFTFMKSTRSGWENYVRDEYTTLPETSDRICATSMDARWTWAAQPADYAAANARILAAMLDVFATTYSASVQDSLYRMGEAALEAVPEIADISLACPNKHYLPINLGPFGMDNANSVFTPTDEPHGQIACTVARGGGGAG